MLKNLTQIISFAAFSIIVLSANSSVRAQCACYEISKDNYACCDGYETPYGSGPNATGYQCMSDGASASQQSSPGECCANTIQNYTFPTDCKPPKPLQSRS